MEKENNNEESVIKKKRLSVKDWLKEQEREALVITQITNNKTIFKRNNITRFNLSDSLILDKDALKLYNFIYLIFQYNREEIPKNNYTIRIKQTLIKNFLDLKTTHYNEQIKNALKQLTNINVILENFVDMNGKSIKEHHTHLITAFTDYLISEDDNKTRTFDIMIDKLMFEEMIQRKPGYTLLNLNFLKSLTKSTQIRLYERCKSYEIIGKTPKFYIEDLNNLFFTNHLYLSKFLPIIDNTILILNKETDLILNYIYNKKDKNIIFKIKKKSKIELSKIEHRENDIDIEIEALSKEDRKIFEALMKFDNI
jgi:hypothetical protein